MPSPLRVAQVVEAVEGGCRKHVFELLRGLDRGRFEQTLIYSPHRDPGFAESVDRATGGGVEAVPCDFRRGLDFGSDRAAYRFLRATFRERRFDVLHFHSAKAGFLGRMAARGLPTGARIYTPHCFPFQMDVGPIRRAAYVWAERAAGKHTDRLVAVAPSEAALATEHRLLPADRVVTIENGIDPARLEQPGDGAGKRAELRIERGAPVVLSIGALRPQKGYEQVIRAMAPLGERCGAVLLIAGDGPLREELGRLATSLGVAEAVRFLGARSDVPELLGTADCFAMPSRWEGGPYALLEAMAAGVPAVGTDIAGIRDWIREGETGRLARLDDAAGMADAIARTIDEPEESRRMAAAARRIVLEHNTLDAWLSKTAGLYEESARERM